MPSRSGRRISSAGDKRGALHLATSYTPNSFDRLKEVGAALDDDVLAQPTGSYKKNPWHLVVLMYGIRFGKRRSRS